MVEDEGIRAEGLGVDLGSRQALVDVHFHARPGAVTAVLGPNGSGKTTLLRALAGLIPYRGTVTLGAKSLASLGARERARLVSYVPQRSLLNAALSIEDIVLQGRYCHSEGFGRWTKKDRDAVEHALLAVDLGGFGARLFTALSGGEQRRVLLARALATEARILLLDEPTAALDIRHALELHALLVGLAGQGRTIVVVLHQLDDALRFADDAALLDRGRVVVQGETRALLVESQIRSIYGVDFAASRGLRFELPQGALDAAG